MRDDFDAVVADRFKLLDDVTVPDTWSRVLDRVAVSDTRSRAPFSDGVTMIDLETPVPPEPRRRVPLRVVVAGLVAAATVVAIALVVTRDRDEGAPADVPVPTVTVPPTASPRALFGTPDGEQFVPGTYFVDEVDGRSTPRIYVTIGAGWSNFINEGLAKAGPTPKTYNPDFEGGGFISFSRPDQVYLDACHLSDGFHPGPVTTLDGLVAALIEQSGWADVTVPSDISVDGYSGKTFQRTAPTVLSGCPNMSPGHMRLPELGGDGLKSWQNEHDSNFGGNYYEPGQVETLMVLDIDGTVVVINANLWPGSSAADRAEFADVLDSIRINPGDLLNVPGTHQLAPGTYFVDRVSGTPTPRIFATLGTGWMDPSIEEGWDILKFDADENPEAPSDELLQHEIGMMSFSNPVAVYSDACHWKAGDHPGPVDSVDGVVAALTEQQGWAEVTIPSDVFVDGYVGKTFQRTAPADMSDCSTRPYRPRTSEGLGSGVLGPNPDFQSWKNANGQGGGGFGYEPGDIENLWVLDIDGTVVVISTRVWPGPSAPVPGPFAAGVLDSIRIERG